MTKTQTQPKYVNLQATAVQVYDERRHPITVLPWSQRGRIPDGQYVVEGVHYQQFVSGRGPLYPFPANPNTPPGPLGETQDARDSRLVAESNLRSQAEGLQASSARGKLRLAGEVVRAGEVVGETQEAFAARLRPALDAVGIRDADAFRKAPRHELLSVEGITEANIARVREMGELIYAPPAEPTEPADDEGGADGGPYNTYALSAVEKMGRARLVKLIQDEGFELSVEGTAAEIRERLLPALREYDMLKE